MIGFDPQNKDNAAPLSERQEAAAVALAELWPGKDKNEVLATYFELIRSPAAQKRVAEWAQEDVDPALQDARVLMLPGLLAVEEKFVEIPRQWHAVFKQIQSKVDSERFVEARFTGLAQLRPRGGPTVFDNAAGERFVYNIENQDIGLGVGFHRSMIDDGLYQANFAPIALGLAESFVQTEEVLHANVLNVGEVYNPSIIGDGCPLFSQKHPYDHGEYSNVGAFGLNEAGLEAVAEKLPRLPDQAGLMSRAKPRMLIVPIEMEAVAYRLMLAMGKDASPAMPSEGYRVLDYLTDPDAWFVKTSLDGLISTKRHPFRLDLCVSGSGLALEASQSYGMGYCNPRSCFASYPKGSVEDRYGAAKSQVDHQMARLTRRDNEVTT